MKTAQPLNRFNNGIADNARDTSPYVQNTSGNFDFFSEKNTITPYRDLTADTVGDGLTMSNIRICDVATWINTGNPGLIGMGVEDTSAELLRIVVKSTVDGAWSNVLTGTGYKIVYNTLVSYLGRAFFIDEIGRLVEYVSPGVSTSIYSTGLGTYVGANRSSIPKPHIHRDSFLYFAVKNVMYRYGINNPVAFPGVYSVVVVFTLSATAIITSITSYGNSLAVAVRYSGGTQNSKILLHSGNYQDTLFIDIIDVGGGDLLVLENIHGVLVGVKQNIDYVGGNVKRFITVVAYGGGDVEIINEIESNGLVLQMYKANRNGRLYFACTGDDALFVVGKNSDGRLILAKDRFLDNGGTLSTIYGFNIINDYLFICGNTNVLKKTTSTATFASSSYFTTAINYGMELGDRTLDKQLMIASLSFPPLTSGQTATIQYKVDGGAWVTAGTRNTVGKTRLTVKTEATGKPFLGGVEYEFKLITTGGLQLTEFKYGYEVTNKFA